MGSVSSSLRLRSSSLRPCGSAWMAGSRRAWAPCRRTCWVPSTLLCPCSCWPSAGGPCATRRTTSPTAAYSSVAWRSCSRPPACGISCRGSRLPATGSMHSRQAQASPAGSPRRPSRPPWGPSSRAFSSDYLPSSASWCSPLHRSWRCRRLSARPSRRCCAPARAVAVSTSNSTPTPLTRSTASSLTMPLTRWRSTTSRSIRRRRRSSSHRRPSRRVRLSVWPVPPARSPRPHASTRVRVTPARATRRARSRSCRSTRHLHLHPRPCSLQHPPVPPSNCRSTRRSTTAYPIPAHSRPARLLAHAPRPTIPSSPRSRRCSRSSTSTRGSRASRAARPSRDTRSNSDRVSRSSE